MGGFLGDALREADYTRHVRIRIGVQRVRKLEIAFKADIVAAMLRSLCRIQCELVGLFETPSMEALYFEK